MAVMFFIVCFDYPWSFPRIELLRRIFLLDGVEMLGRVLLCIPLSNDILSDLWCLVLLVTGAEI